ncbi:restriction endonuclease subunit S [Nocardia farcinica]|uniref:restriction endonuclease subunit S n=1 Tax=Nocardia farcinica TaxID=37329 RepID=UPI0024581014|nr:restriction endonuclease subunit S [Nocardia farcinica]
MFELPKYTSFRSIASPWLERIPSHWQAVRTKSMLHERSIKGYPDEPLLAATQTHGVIRKSEYGARTVTATKDLHLLKLVEVGDFVISLRSFQGGIERCYHRGIISPAYTVLTANSETYRDYLTHLFKSTPFISSLSLAVTGIREGQTIDYSKLATELLPVPPPDEQAAIVKYLAHANARIDKAIAAKRRLMALLLESRATSIDALVLGREVTDRTTSMAPWLQSIPVGWQWRRCRTITSFITSGSRGWAEYYSDHGAMFLQSGNLGRRLDLKLGDVQRVALPPSVTEGLRTRVEARDLLVCITGALTGNVALVPHSWDDEAYVNQHVALLRPRHEAVNPEFLGYAMKAMPSQVQFRGSEYGGTKQGLGLDEIKNLEVLLPPLSEQDRIVDQIGVVARRTDAAIKRAEREIELLTEFRTRLVADVVTGQVDVRGVAASLPEVDADAMWAGSDAASGSDTSEFEDLVEVGED